MFRLKFIVGVSVTIIIIIVQNCHCLSLIDNNYYDGEVTKVLQKVVQNYDKNPSEVTINETCMAQIQLFLANLQNATGDDIWAIKMIDATGKIPPGILDINLAWVGRYDECLNIESALTKVKGKYCLASLSLDNVTDNPSTADSQIFIDFKETRQVLNRYLKQLQESTSNSTEFLLPILPSLGICVPDQCTAYDVQSTLSSLLADISWEVTCQTKESIQEPLDVGAILTVSFFTFFTCVMALSTSYDVLKNKDNKSHPLLIAFSVYSNGRKLLQTTKNPDDLSCLHGIRCLSMMWVIYGHLFQATFYGPTSNVMDIINFFGYTKSMIMSNAFFSVDTFFVVTGMLVVYSFMKAAHRGHKFNIFVYYLHRYLRLTPALIPTLLLTLYLTKYLGSGPFHPQLDPMIIKPCKDNWWSVLLHLQNYVRFGNACLGQTWYLDIDWQIYVLAPIFLLFLPKRPVIGLTIMICCLICSMVAAFVITWEYQLPALQTDIHGKIQDYSTYYYNKTHTRASSWLIGGFLGYILAKIKIEKNLNYMKLPKWLIGTVWLIVLAAIPACVFAGHDVLFSEEYHPYLYAFYNALARPAWTICIAWIIYACSIGYGGIINTFLSWSAFQVLGRFVFSIYLVHMTLINIIWLSKKQPGYFSMFNLAYDFWGISALSLGISIFWVLAFESPIIALEKYLLGGTSKQIKEKQVQNGAEIQPAEA